MSIFVTNLGYNIQLLENKANELFYIKLFTTHLDYNTFIEKYNSSIETYIINNLNVNQIDNGQYSIEEILNYKPIISLQIAYDKSDYVKYPIMMLIMPLDHEKNDLKLRFMQELSFNTNDIKLLKDNKLNIIYTYLSKYFGDHILYYDYS